MVGCSTIRALAKLLGAEITLADRARATLALKSQGGDITRIGGMASDGEPEKSTFSLPSGNALT